MQFGRKKKRSKNFMPIQRNAVGKKNAPLMEKQHRKVRVLSFYHAVIVGVVS
jgi:hypothetical protein